MTVLPGTRDARDPQRSLTPTGHGYSREEIAAIQKDRLRDAVVQVCSEQGYERARIKEICARAGVGLATFYQQYDSKDALVLDAYDAGVADLFGAVSEAFEAPVDSAPMTARIELGIRVLLETLAMNPPFASFFLVEIHKAGTEGDERVESALEAAYAMFSGTESSDGQDPPDPELVPLLVGGIYAHLSRYVRTGRTAELPTLLPALIRFSVAVTGQSAVTAINLTPPRR